MKDDFDWDNCSYYLFVCSCNSYIDRNLDKMNWNEVCEKLLMNYKYDKEIIKRNVENLYNYEYFLCQEVLDIIRKDENFLKYKLLKVIESL